MPAGIASWNQRSRFLLVGFVLTALLSTSCSGHSGRSAQTAKGGGDTTTTAGPATTTPRFNDPCALVSLTQAETLVGGAELLPGLGVRTDDPNDRACTYTAPPNAPAAQVEVLAGPRAKAALAGSHGRLTAVARIGHEAHEEDTAIYFRKQTTWVVIRVSGGAGPKALRPQLEALARAVTPKI